MMTRMTLPSFRRPPPSGARTLLKSSRPTKCSLWPPVSKARTLLPLLPLELVSAGDADHVLAEVEMEAERFLGSFQPREYDALMMAKLPNGGHLNRVLG
jgi:hypothetical protein